MHWLIRSVARLIADPIEAGSKKGALAGVLIGAPLGAGFGFIWCGFVPAAHIVAVPIGFALLCGLLAAPIGARFHRS